MQLGQIALSFVFVIALMVALAYGVKRLGLQSRLQLRSSTQGLLNIEDSLILDPRRRVMVLRMEEKRYVVLLDHERTHVLDTLTSPPQRDDTV